MSEGEMKTALERLVEAVRHEVRKELIRGLAGGVGNGAVEKPREKRAYSIKGPKPEPAQVLGALPGRRSQIAKKLGKPPHQVNIVLTELRKRGIVRMEGTRGNAIWHVADGK